MRDGREGGRGRVSGQQAQDICGVPDRDLRSRDLIKEGSPGGHDQQGASDIARNRCGPRAIRLGDNRGEASSRSHLAPTLPIREEGQEGDGGAGHWSLTHHARHLGPPLALLGCGSSSPPWCRMSSAVLRAPLCTWKEIIVSLLQIHGKACIGVNKVTYGNKQLISLSNFIKVLKKGYKIVALGHTEYDGTTPISVVYLQRAGNSSHSKTC